MNTINLIGNIVLVVALISFALHFTGIFLIRYAKKYRWAIIFYSCKIKLIPILSSDYNSRACAYTELQEYERAIQDCNQAIALRPEGSIAYVNRGAAYLRLKRYQEALQDFNRAIELKPNIGMTYGHRCVLYLRMREYQRARQDADQAIALRPNNSRLYTIRGSVFIRLKEFQRARQDLDQAISLDPAYSGSYYYRGYLYLHLNDFEQGRADILKAWELQPTSSVYGWMVEFCKLCVEKPDLATAERLEKLASLDPDPDAAHLACICRGTALWLRERHAEALSELKQALTLEPAFESASFWLGMTYASLGRDEEAKQALTQALESGLPRALLAPLKLLQEKKPAFFERYAEPLFISVKINDVRSHG